MTPRLTHFYSDIVLGGVMGQQISLRVVQLRVEKPWGHLMEMTSTAGYRLFSSDVRCPERVYVQKNKSLH